MYAKLTNKTKTGIRTINILIKQMRKPSGGEHDHPPWKNAHFQHRNNLQVK